MYSYTSFIRLISVSFSLQPHLSPRLAQYGSGYSHLMEADLVKQLKIKAGAVKRTNREYHSYEEELRTERDRLQKLTTSGASDHAVKKQQDVIQESISMLPNTKKRLQDAVDDLQSFLQEQASNTDLTQSDEWRDAQTQIQTAVNGVLNLA